MSWQIPYTISNSLKTLILDICNIELEKNPDPQDAWQRTSHITLDSHTWSFYKAQGLIEVQEQLKIFTGLNTAYKHGFCCIWRYDADFPKCPIHIDDKAQHKGSICISLTGKHEIFLHDEKTKEKTESVIISDNTIIFLRNSEYYHSVEGNGDLLCLGVEA